MTVGELRDFCEAREVEVAMRYRQGYDSITITMRKGTRETHVAIRRDAAVAKQFGLAARTILELMAARLEDVEKVNKTAAVPSRP